MSERAKAALSYEVLRGLVGSTAHGTAVDGQDDRDEMAIAIEPIHNVVGLETFTHYVERTQPEGVRSGPGDLDLVVYSLRRYCELAINGNPSILLLMWLPHHLIRRPIGAELCAIREAFVSKQAGERFVGYLRAQRMAMTGERNKKVSRPELVEKYGFDTKFAVHALRLAYQGVEFMRHGWISMPVPEPALTTLRAVRTGEVSFQHALALINAAEIQLQIEVDSTDAKADFARVNRFLVEAHQDFWRQS